MSKRADGYHNLESIFQELSLADELLIERADEFSLATNQPGLPVDETNLCTRAYRLLAAEYGIKVGLKIFINKRIPLGSGLGGGSSDAAGTLLALNIVTGRPLDEARLHRLGSQLGADVPFFLRPGPKIGRGIGNELSPLNLPPYWYVLLNPGLAISTQWVYENLDLSALNRVNRVADMGWDVERPGDWVANDLETVTLKHFPELKAHIQALARLGALAQGKAAQNLFDDTVTRRRLEALFAGFAATLSADTGALAADAIEAELRAGGRTDG